MYNESKRKQEAVPREDHVQLAHPPQLPHPPPVATLQLHPVSMKATSQSIYLRQPRRPVEPGEEQEVLVEGVLEEQLVLTLQA